LIILNFEIGSSFHLIKWQGSNERLSRSKSSGKLPPCPKTLDDALLLLQIDLQKDKAVIARRLKRSISATDKRMRMLKGGLRPKKK